MMAINTGTCIHCGASVEMIGGYVWWSDWGGGVPRASATCKDGVRDHFAPTDAHAQPLTADEAMAGLTRVHAKLIELITPGLADDPKTLALLATIPAALRANDEKFPLEDNRPDWSGQSDKGRALQREPFYGRLWVLGDGIVQSPSKERILSALPEGTGPVVECLAANLRGEVNHYACGYFELVMQTIDDTLEWCERQIAKATAQA